MTTIVIMCDSYYDAVRAFDIFVTFLKEREPECIEAINTASNSIKTTNDLNYIFIDYQYEGLFDTVVDYLMSIEAFAVLEGIDDLYFDNDHIKLKDLITI